MAGEDRYEPWRAVVLLLLIQLPLWAIIIAVAYALAVLT